MTENENLRKPTVRQVYAIAAVLLERAGEEFPATVSDASALLDKLRGTKPAAA